MCQLNLYLLPEAVPEEQVIAAFSKCGMKAERCSLAVRGVAGQAAYAAGWCNCDSVVSRATRDYGLNTEDSVGYASFEEYVACGLRNLRERAQQYERLCQDPNFPAKNAAFEAERERLMNALLSLTKYVGEYEISETEKLEKEGLPEAEFSAKMRTVYERMEQMYREAEARPEYLAAQKAVEDFLSQNQELEKFWGYDPKTVRGSERDYRRMVKGLKREFTNLSKLLARLAALGGGVGLYPFWQDGSEENGPMELAGKREKPAASLTIDDLALLPYQNLLWLSRD